MIQNLQTIIPPENKLPKEYVKAFFRNNLIRLKKPPRLKITLKGHFRLVLGVQKLTRSGFNGVSERDF